MKVPPARRAINRLFNRLSPHGRKRVHGAFGMAMAPGIKGWKGDAWPVEFAGRTIVAPLRRDSLHEDWMCAITLLGHDVEEKQSYANLLASPQRPALFIDVGGNFGTHSLQMLAHGVAVIYVEPNPACHGYFAAACAANGYAPRVEAVAMGAEAGEIQLRFPRAQTWLGSTQPLENEDQYDDLEIIDVPVRTLDSYLDTLPAGQVLLKIDAEGHEEAVLAGATRLLAERRPIILFECHRDDARRAGLAQIFADADYRVTLHSWPQPALDTTGFLAAPSHNFLAVPAEQVAG